MGLRAVIWHQEWAARPAARHFSLGFFPCTRVRVLSTCTVCCAVRLQPANHLRHARPDQVIHSLVQMRVVQQTKEYLVRCDLP